MDKTIFLIAGEASGDMHGARLMEALQKRDANIRFVGLGGDKMREAGCQIMVDYRQMAYMGVMAVLANLHKIRCNLRIARQALLQEKPQVLVLIDYPSFNLRIAEFCRKQLPNTRIIYYIPPKVWAWKRWRIHKIARLSDEVLGIFPFEESFYQQYGYTCRYVGNPTAEVIRSYAETHPASERERVIALLPGSRKSEIRHCLPTMLAAASHVAKEKYRIVVAGAPGIEDAFYAPFLASACFTRDTYSLMQRASVAVVNSGTATLEAALLGCPEMAVYYIAGSKWLQWLLEPIVFRTPWYTLVNILLQKTAIQELIAKRFTQVHIETELSHILTDKAYREQMLKDFEHISSMLGTESAAENAANIVVHYLPLR